MTELQRLVRRLRQEPGLSRNRHFDELSQPAALRARRVARWLAGLERDIEAGAEVALRRQRDGWLLRIVFPAVRAMRETLLTDEEFELLREGGLLAGHIAPADADDRANRPGAVPDEDGAGDRS